MKESYSKSRKKTFEKIIKCLDSKVNFSNNQAVVAQGDSLEILKLIPDNSISLILTDPPYHSTKKDNITNDKAFKTDESFLEWMNLYFEQWKRILKTNGSIFVYCSSAMSARLEVLMSSRFNVLSHIVWTKPNDPGFDGWKGKMKKESLRQWYAHSERIIFAEPACEGNLKRTWFGQFLKQKRTEAKLSGNLLTELTGSYGKVNHGGAVSNWETGRNIPNREQYAKICDAILSTGVVKNMPLYEDVIRPFEVNAFVEFTDVWNFNSVKPYKGKHPAEKPLDMLEHCISSTTYEDDIILDCFAGSGSTAIAALNLKRKSVSIEIETDWVNSIIERVKNHSSEHINTLSNKHDIMKVSINKLNVLF